MSTEELHFQNKWTEVLKKRATQKDQSLSGRESWAKARDHLIVRGKFPEAQYSLNTRALIELLDQNDKTKLKSPLRKNSAFTLARLAANSQYQQDISFQSVGSSARGYSKGWNLIMNNILNPLAPKREMLLDYQREQLKKKLKRYYSQQSLLSKKKQIQDDQEQYRRNDTVGIFSLPKDDVSPYQSRSSTPLPISQKNRRKLEELNRAKIKLHNLEQTFDKEQKYLTDLCAKFKLKHSSSQETLSYSQCGSRFALSPQCGSPISRQTTRNHKQKLQNKNGNSSQDQFRSQSPRHTRRSTQPKKAASRIASRGDLLTFIAKKELSQQASGLILPTLTSNLNSPINSKLIIPQALQFATQRRERESVKKKNKFIERIALNSTKPMKVLKKGLRGGRELL